MVGLDKYAIAARFFPFLIVILPVGMAIAVWFPSDWIGWTVGVGLLGSSGLAVLIAELVRDPGKVKEPALFERWGGKPTTQLLRHRDTDIDPATKARYHKYLAQTVPHATLPSAQQEGSAPDTADASYASCVELLSILDGTAISRT